MSRTRIQRGDGFTLIELLVALLILAILAAMGYGAYRTARISAEQTEASLQRSREIEFGMRILTMDLTQVVPRPVRASLGDGRIPALHGFSGNGTSAGTTGGSLGGTSSSLLGSSTSLLGSGSTSASSSSPNFNSAFAGSNSTSTIALAEFTRAGWSNTAGQQRSTLQRVSYALVNDVLKRAYTTSLDIVQATQPRVQDLFGKVKTVQLRYLDGNQAWQNQWPPPGIGQPEALWTRPIAIEVTIEFTDWGRVRRLIEVAG